MENKLYEGKCISSSDRNFWSYYINILLKNGILEKKSKWYVNFVFNSRTHAPILKNFKRIVSIVAFAHWECFRI